MGATYQHAEHGGEVELEFEAPTEAGVFEAALAASAELVAEDGGGERATYEIDVAEKDRSLLLVAWLNELVLLAEVERFVPERIVSAELGDRRLHARVEGHHRDVRHLVKAVTLNNLSFVDEGGAWHARVVLDV